MGCIFVLKAATATNFIHSPRRLEKPRLRKYLLDGTSRPKNRGAWVEVDWDTALDTTAHLLQQTREKHGAIRLDCLSSGRNLNEENYLMNKFARQVLGTNNIDTCTHLYHPGTVAGLNEVLGLHSQSNSLDDVANFARSMLIIGSNTTEEHPVFGAKIRQAVLRRECKLVVAHPDFINISEYATLRLIHKYGSDATLIHRDYPGHLEKWLGRPQFYRKPHPGF